MAGTIDLGIDNIVEAQEIGRGGFSTVYAAIDTQFDRRVAVKVLRPLTKESDRNRFERECKVMGRLSSNDGVVTVYNAGYTTYNEPYIVMALNEGGSLAELLTAAGPMDWKRACRFMIPIAGALAAAHEAQILHRDVKPENILVDGDRARLTDFGIARLGDAGGSTSTNITATWLHTAPETFDNKRDERSDIYSTASTLYCLIAGQAPFQDPRDESLNPLMRRLLDQEPPMLGATRVPATLDQYLQRCLAKDPGARPQTAQELADGLQLLVDSNGSQGPAHAPSANLATQWAPPSAPGSNQRQPPGMGPAPANHTVQVGPMPNPGLSGPPPPWNPSDSVDHLDWRGGSPSFQPLASPSDGGANVSGGDTPSPSPQASWVRPNPVLLPPVDKRSGRRAQVAIAAAVVLAIAVVAGLGYGATQLTESPVEDVATAGVDPSSESVEGPVSSVTAAPDSAAEGETEPPAADETVADGSTTGRGLGGPDQPVIAPVFEGEASSLDELEARWAESRSAVVASLSSDAYGIDDQNVLHGPAGFEVDLNECPLGWSDTGGVDDSSISFGHTTAQSGTLAAYGDIGTGMETYFDYVNANGGIGGRSIELVVKDDGYDARLTPGQVDELLAENSFAITTLGTPNSLAVIDTLNEACVPQPFVMSSHPAWGDPEQQPFTTGLQLTYATEARMWGSWIEQNFAGELPVGVSALVMDNDFGLAYQSAFESWVAEHPNVVSEINFVPHDPIAATVVNEIATAFGTSPTVFIAMTAGSPCLWALQEVEAQGFRDGLGAYLHPSVCKDSASFVAPAGQAGDGIIVLGGGLKVSNDPAIADDPFVSFLNDELDAAGLDQTVGLYGSGFGLFGWAHVEALRIADELPGGLTRSNLLLAMRGLQLEHPMLLDGIGFKMWGNDDSFAIESSEVARYDVADEAWIATGPIIDIEGETPNCSWGLSGCT